MVIPILQKNLSNLKTSAFNLSTDGAFIDFNENDIAFIVQSNTNQQDSRTKLDAFFTESTTINVNASWIDLTPFYTINITDKITFNEATNTFQYTGIRSVNVNFISYTYVETGNNNVQYEFATFKDKGDERGFF